MARPPFREPPSRASVKAKEKISPPDGPSTPSVSMTGGGSFSKWPVAEVATAQACCSAFTMAASVLPSSGAAASSSRRHAGTEESTTVVISHLPGTGVGRARATSMVGPGLDTVDPGRPHVAANPKARTRGIRVATRRTKPGGYPAVNRAKPVRRAGRAESMRMTQPWEVTGVGVPEGEPVEWWIDGTGRLADQPV